MKEREVVIQGTGQWSLVRFSVRDNSEQLVNRASVPFQVSLQIVKRGTIPRCFEFDVSNNSVTTLIN